MKKKSLSLIKVFLPFLRPFLWKYVYAGSLTVLSAAAELTGPLVLMILIDYVIPSKDHTVLTWFGLGFILLYLFRSTLDFLRGKAMAVIMENVIRNIQAHVYKHVQTLPLSSFDARKTGYLTNRVFNDSQQLSSLTGGTFISIIINSCVALGTLCVVFVLNWKLTLVAVSVVPAFVLIIKIFNRWIRNLSRDIQEEKSTVYGEIQENFAGIRVIKSFGLENKRGQCVEDSLDRNKDLSIKLGILNGLNISLVLACTTVGGVGILWFGSSMVMGEALTVGELMAFSAYAVNIYGPVRNLMGINVGIQQSLGSAERIVELLDEKPHVSRNLDAPYFQFEGNVSYRNVSFAYNSSGRSNQLVLKNIDMEVKAGETIALVGQSGAGKTTILNLLSRFYDPVEGEVFIDGHDLRDIHSDALKDQIGIVAQDDFLFSTSIMENIRYGNLAATDGEVKEAARKANAHLFVEDLPEGYNTVVGERGLGLSGGERQRISIARAFLKNPTILILDEATSSVDSKTENLIKESLYDLMKDRTTFIIAHRFSTVVDAGKIVVMDQGKIAASGRHEDLYANSPIYKNLYDEQLSGLQNSGITRIVQDDMTEIIIDRGPKDKKIVTIHV